MSRVSLTRTHVLAVPSVLGALLVGACWSTPAAPGGTGGSNAGGAGGSSSRGGPAAPAPAGRAAPAPTGTGGSTASCGAVGPTTGAPGFGAPTQAGAGTSTAKYFGADVTRDGVSYRFITNWWGPGWTTAERLLQRDVLHGGERGGDLDAGRNADRLSGDLLRAVLGERRARQLRSAGRVLDDRQAVDGLEVEHDRPGPVQRRLGHLAGNGVGVSVVPDGLAARSAGRDSPPETARSTVSPWPACPAPGTSGTAP